MSDIERASTYFRGISNRDPALATVHVHPVRYVEHNPHVRDGVEGLRQNVNAIAGSSPYLKVVRAFQDGPYVVTQADGHIGDHYTFFDVFRFDDGKIIEHWAFSSEAGPPNKSGHTQLDGPTEARPDVDGEQSKALVRAFYEAVHLNHRDDLVERYVALDMARHETGVADGLEAFQRDLEVLTKDRIIEDIKLLLGQGDFVFLVATGTHRGDPCAYVDLYRVEDNKLIDHWGFRQEIPAPEKRRNFNDVV